MQGGYPPADTQRGKMKDFLKRGYIRIFRGIDQWEWYTENNTFKLFIHCLLKANYSQKSWRGIKVERGSFLTSREKLSAETGLTVQEVRTAIRHLISTKEITCKTTNRNTIITVNNWDKFQIDNQQTNQQLTNDQPTTNQRLTTTNNKKNNELIMINNELIINSENSKKISDPFYSKEIQKFLSEFKKRTHCPVAMKPDERECLLNTLNDLVEQGYTLDNIIDTLCSNFNSIKFNLTTFTPSINWLLENNAEQFYKTLNGQHNKKLSEQEQFLQEMKEKEEKERQEMGWN